MLETDLACCFAESAGAEEIEQVLAQAPELGDYVCRQCDECSVLSGADGQTLKRIFELEGKTDRQMDDRRNTTAAQYALSERLKGWFGSAARARKMYGELPMQAAALAEQPLKPCCYGIDIKRKLSIADAKLQGGDALRLL
jgi:hypothetical protein